eukprot:Trichotokara_eunicae@DN1949_c0_g1_i6.p1
MEEVERLKTAVLDLQDEHHTSLKEKEELLSKITDLSSEIADLRRLRVAEATTGNRRLLSMQEDLVKNSLPPLRKVLFEEPLSDMQGSILKGGAIMEKVKLKTGELVKVLSVDIAKVVSLADYIVRAVEDPRSHESLWEFFMELAEEGGVEIPGWEAAKNALQTNSEMKYRRQVSEFERLLLRAKEDFAVAARVEKEKYKQLRQQFTKAHKSGVVVE